MPDIDVRLVDVTKSFGPDVVAVDHISLDVLRRRVLLAARSVGLRQDHDAAHDRRLRGAHQRPHRAPGPGRHVAAALQAQRQHRVPELRPLPAPDHLRERGLRPAPAQGRPAPRSRSASPEMLELVELRGFDQRKPGQISGGQAQRVALARALINRPAVLLLDEPLGALDLKLRKQMQVELKRIQQDVGITFIYVTHDQEEAMTMSDRIAVMNRGRYEQLGRAGGALRAPGDPVRGRVPGRQQPAARACRGHRRRARASSGSTGITWSGCRRAQLGGPDARSTSASGRRRSGCSRPTRPGACRRQHPVGTGPQRPLHGRQHPVPGRAARRLPGGGLRAEPRTGARLHPVAAGRGGRARAGPPTTRSRSTRPRPPTRPTPRCWAWPRRPAPPRPEHDPIHRSADRRPRCRPDRPATTSGQPPRHAHQPTARAPDRRGRRGRRLPWRHRRSPWSRRRTPAARRRRPCEMATWIGYMDYRRRTATHHRSSGSRPRPASPSTTRRRSTATRSSSPRTSRGRSRTA